MARKANASPPVSVSPGLGRTSSERLEAINRISECTSRQNQAPITEGIAPDNGARDKVPPEAIIICAIVAISILNAALILSR